MIRKEILISIRVQLYQIQVIYIYIKASNMIHLDYQAAVQMLEHYTAIVKFNRTMPREIKYL